MNSILLYVKHSNFLCVKYGDLPPKLRILSLASAVNILLIIFCRLQSRVHVTVQTEHKIFKKMEEVPPSVLANDKISEQVVVSRANPERKVYNATAGKIRVINQIPDDILNDKKLALAIELLPSNYSFEIHKTVYKVIRFTT